MNRVSKLPGYAVLKPKVMISATKETEFMNPDKFDARRLFLKQRLAEKIGTCHEQTGHEVPSSNQVNMDQENQKRFDVFTLPSDQESEVEAREKSHKKSRVHKFSKLKVITKIRDQRVQLSKATEINIVQLIDKLREIAPTLPASEHGTIFMKSLFQLIIEINTKLNCFKETRSHETSIPLDREIKISKAHGKEEIKLNDRMNLPLLAYAKAIDADKPHLVVSRIIRFCFDTDFKLNCELNEEPNESNFLYRLGNSNLEGMERVEDGRDILDMIIEHAHMVKEYSSMSSQSYRESMQQVTKALYDCKRREIDRLEKVLEQERHGKQDFNQEDDTVEIQYEDLEAIHDKHDNLATNLLTPSFSFHSI
ncbi:uncharacterized protein LOC112539343 [Tetranychus urticae]|nr:uncharacterized protein LOC112539343 [Tetranychus urticae]